MRLSSLLLLLSWIPTLVVGGSVSPAAAPLHRDLLGAAQAVAAHDVGPRRAQPFEATVADAAPRTTVRSDQGADGTPPSVRITAARAGLIAHSGAIHGSRADRLNTLLAQTRARSGFLTAASSTAPPCTHL